MIGFFLSGKYFPRSREHEILVPLSMGVGKKNQKSIVDEYASHMTLFIQALSLEHAGERRFCARFHQIKSTWLVTQRSRRLVP